MNLEDKLAVNEAKWESKKSWVIQNRETGKFLLFTEELTQDGEGLISFHWVSDPVNATAYSQTSYFDRVIDLYDEYAPPSDKTQWWFSEIEIFVSSTWRFETLDYAKH
jgi:hypothetical protein